MATDIYRLMKKKPVDIVDGVWNRTIEGKEIPRTDFLLRDDILNSLTTWHRRETSKYLYLIVRKIAEDKLKILYEKKYTKILLNIVRY